jgi:hypothetical protein
MLNRLLAMTAIGILAIQGLAGPPPPVTPAQKGPDVPGDAPELVKWNLDRLRQEPFKLIKATPDPQTGQVRFLVEFTRRPELAEMFDWEHRGAPVLFRFQDEDGVVLRTIKPRLEGELISEKGARFRLILQMPEEQLLIHTYTIKAED